MSTEKILAKLDSAFKSIVDVSELNEGILQTAKFDAFVDAMQKRTRVIPDARFLEMEAHKQEIDRVGFVDRVLSKGIKGDGSTEGSDSWKNPTINSNKLIAQELRGQVALTDRALRRNIERGDFEDHLVNLFGEAAGRDFEEWAILANEDDLTDAGILEMTDGWAKLAGNHVFGQGSNSFDPDNPEEIFDALLDAVGKEYLVDRSEWRFYVPYEVEDGYRDSLKARGTALGDTAQTTADQLVYKGIPVVYVPLIDRSKQPDETGTEKGVGRIAMLQHPDNMVWGVFHEVNIERYRNAQERRTEFYLTIECDAHYEDEDGAATAFLDKESVS